MDIQMTDSARIIFLVASFVFGSLVGSFLNVCVHRLPQGLSVVRPRSRCPKCENPIAWHDNVPMVSWLILGAKCRNCGEPISWQYPLVEALTGTLFLLVYWRFGLTLATPIYMLYCAAMVVVTFVDLTDWTIPNEITYPGIPIGIGLSVVAMFYKESGLQFDEPLWAIGAAFGAGTFLYLLDKASLLFLGKRGMGFGDVKLIAMIGAFFGLWGAMITIVVASVVGSAVGIPMLIADRRKGKKEGEESEGTYLPFGPYLCIGSLVSMFFGPQIVGFYFRELFEPGIL